ncbi:MAG: hypothetical protein R2911_28760 [Caldilineaceae bacterium]
MEITGDWNRPPLEREATEEIFGRAREIGVNLGLALQGDGTGGGSDGNFTGALGIPRWTGWAYPATGPTLIMNTLRRIRFTRVRRCWWRC